MPIPVAPRTKSRVTLVYTLDDCVEPKAKGALGWIRADDAVCQDDADRVTVRPLNIDERAACDDAGGANQRALARTRTGVVSVQRGGKALKKGPFLEALDDVCVRLLGMYIMDLTQGRDTDQAKYAKHVDLGDGDDESEGAGDDESGESG